MAKKENLPARVAGLDKKLAQIGEADRRLLGFSEGLMAQAADQLGPVAIATLRSGLYLNAGTSSSGDLPDPFRDNRVRLLAQEHDPDSVGRFTKVYHDARVEFQTVDPAGYIKRIGADFRGIAGMAEAAKQFYHLLYVTSDLKQVEASVKALSKFLDGTPVVKPDKRRGIGGWLDRMFDSGPTPSEVITSIIGLVGENGLPSTDVFTKAVLARYGLLLTAIVSSRELFGTTAGNMETIVNVDSKGSYDALHSYTFQLAEVELQWKSQEATRAAAKADCEAYQGTIGHAEEVDKAAQSLDLATRESTKLYVQLCQISEKRNSCLAAVLAGSDMAEVYWARLAAMEYNIMGLIDAASFPLRVLCHVTTSTTKALSKAAIMYDRSERARILNIYARATEEFPESLRATLVENRAQVIEAKYRDTPAKKMLPSM